MAATIDVACPECKKQMKAPAEMRGKKVKCKACGHTFTVAGAAAPPSPAARGAPGKKATTAGKPDPAAAPAKTKAVPPPPTKKPDEEEVGGLYAFADPD